MWESIKRFFGFGKKEEVVTVATEVKAELNIEVPVVKVEAPRKPKAPKAPKVKSEAEVKVTAKEIKSKVKKEPRVEKVESKKPSKKKTKKSE
jgi:hypothetical protein